MLSNLFNDRKRIIITMIIITGIATIGLSYAFFSRQSLFGETSNNTITVQTISGTSRSFTTTYENGTMEVETGILNLTDTPYTDIYKFKVHSIYTDSQDITINWNLVKSSLASLYSTYYLYECSQSNYNSATISDVASRCTLISPSIGNTLPNTGEKNKLQENDIITLNSNQTKYYITVIDIGVENNGKQFQANIKVQDCNSHILNINANGGTIAITSVEVENGESLILPYPTKSGDAFFGWELTQGTGAYVTENKFFMGQSDATIKALWVKEVISYSGSFSVIDDGGGNWRLKLLSDGDFSSSQDLYADIFLVGGGGGGGRGNANSEFSAGRGGGGGGGGYTTNASNISLSQGESLSVVIGGGGAERAAGGTTTFSSYSAAGGAAGGNASSSAGGTGGAGGSGGGNGAPSTPTYGGSYGSSAGWLGQGQTTCEFGEGTITGCTGGTAFAYSGGGGGGGSGAASLNLAGGIGGGGAGKLNYPSSPQGSHGASNTGGGGGASFFHQSYAANRGGTGIVVIRNAR